MTEPRHPLDGNMIAADRHYADGDDPPCTFCGGEGCDGCDEWYAAIDDCHSDEGPHE